MEITILIDNKKNDQIYRSEHGLSVLIEFQEKTILFDTGKTDAFIQNAIILGKNLSKVDYVILSHGHYDHTGGLDAFLRLNKTATIVLKQEALQEKRSQHTGINKDISFPLKDSLEAFTNPILFIDNNQELLPELWIMAHIEKDDTLTLNDSVLFIKQNNEFIPDPFNDELFITIKYLHKLVIITGCAHNGIGNIVQTAINHTQLHEVEMLIGGLHLNKISEEQLNHTITKLKKFSIHKGLLNHCSGEQHIQVFNKHLPGKFEYATGGSIYKMQ
jgi:7,8-dihydropterin-6-yl-methyl-4-(beta-D-ribofuranosyl)aminobenzene 5'-phosphate synthase